MYDQISAVSVSENKHAHQLHTGFVRYMMEMTLLHVAPVTKGYFFLFTPC